MAPLQIDLPQARIEDFCCRWKITELAAFGSVLREDFAKGSDVDLLVTFTPGRGTQFAGPRADAGGIDGNPRTAC